MMEKEKISVQVIESKRSNFISPNDDFINMLMIDFVMSENITIGQYSLKYY